MPLPFVRAFFAVTATFPGENWTTGSQSFCEAAERGTPLDRLGAFVLLDGRFPLSDQALFVSALFPPGSLLSAHPPPIVFPSLPVRVAAALGDLVLPCVLNLVLVRGTLLNDVSSDDSCHASPSLVFFSEFFQRSVTLVVGPGFNSPAQSSPTCAWASAAASRAFSSLPPSLPCRVFADGGFSAQRLCLHVHTFLALLVAKNFCFGTGLGGFPPNGSFDACDFGFLSEPQHYGFWVDLLTPFLRGPVPIFFGTLVVVRPFVCMLYGGPTRTLVRDFSAAALFLNPFLRRGLTGSFRRYPLRNSLFILLFFFSGVFFF